MLKENFGLSLRQMTCVDFQGLQFVLIWFQKIFLTYGGLPCHRGDPSASLSRFFEGPLFLIQLQCIIIVVKCLLTVSNTVETSSSCKESVDVCGVEFYDNGEILDGDFHLLQFLVGAANDVIGPHVALIQIEQSVAVVDGFCEHAFLHVGAGPDEEGLPV